MKGNYVQGPLLWEIETKGENWPQGAFIEGRIGIKNQGTEGQSLGRPGVGLCFGGFRGVHAKNEKALKREQESFLEQGLVLAPGEARSLDFKFQLPPNCPITDKRASYYLSYGPEAQGSHLQLTVAPRPLFMKTVELLGNFQRFKLKEFKASKKGVEFKLIPPQSRDLAGVENLILTMRMEGEDLQMDFLFNTRKMNLALPISAPPEKEVKEISKALTPKQYLMGRDMPNQDALLKVLEEAVAHVKMRPLL